MVQLGLLALRFLRGRLSCSRGEEGGESGARVEGLGNEGGAEEEGWFGGTAECLEMSCSFDLLVSPVAGSACLTGLQLSSVLFISSCPSVLTNLQFLSILLPTTVSAHFVLFSPDVCLSELRLSLLSSTFPLSIFSSSLLVSSVLCLSSFTLLCFDFPSLPLSFFFFLPSSFLPSLFAFSASNLLLLDFLSFLLSFFVFLSFSLFFSAEGCNDGSCSWSWAAEGSTAGEDCGLGVSEGKEGESGLLLLDWLSSFWELLEAGGLVRKSAEETEVEPLGFLSLIFEEAEVLRRSAEPFPLDNPFCFDVCTKPLCFLEVFPSLLVSDAGRAWMLGLDGELDVVWSTVGEHGF